MKNKITLLFSLIISIAFAQDPSYVWTKAVGASGYDFGLSIDYDSSGNVVTAGYFSNTVDFDPGSGSFPLSTGSNSNAFIQKLDANGNFLWAVSFGTSGYSDIASDVVVDANDNVIVTGFFKGTVDFDPGSGVVELVATNYYKNYVVKLDPNGNLVWAKAFGRTSYSDDYGSIAVDANGNIYTTSYFRNTADFNPNSGTYNVTSRGFSDVFIHKLDANGNFGWVRTFGSINGHDIGHGIVVSDSGNVYTTGEFLSTVDFNTGSGILNRSSNGIRDYYVHKLDTNGNFIWVRTAGGFANEIGRGIALDSNENVYFVGYMEDTADLDPSSGVYNVTVVGAYNGFIAKFNSSGNFQWAHNIDGMNVRSDVKDVAIDTEDNIYFAGSFQNTADFDFSSGVQEMTSNGDDDFFVGKIDGNSTFLWSKSIGSSSWDIAYGIKIGPLNEIYTTGTFTGSVDFDFTTNTDHLNRGSGYTVFTTKWDNSNALSITEATNTVASTLFPNPAKEKVNVRFPNSMHTVETTLLNISGDVLFQKKYQNVDMITLELPNLSNGIYFLNVKSNLLNETQKLIID